MLQCTKLLLQAGADPTASCWYPGHDTVLMSDKNKDVETFVPIVIGMNPEEVVGRYSIT